MQYLASAGGGFLLKRLWLVGGDGRMLRLSRMLAQQGYEVRTLGLTPGDEQTADGAWAHAVLFPYPYAVRDGLVPTLTGLSLHPEDVLRDVPDNTPLLAGAGLEKYILDDAVRSKRLRLMLYGSYRPFLDANAALSAEAAVAEAMKRTDEALMDMTVLITGYGRFGRALAQRLKALGADVWVAARRDAQRLLAMSDGMRAVALEDIVHIAPRLRRVRNTIPARGLDEETLCARPKHCCLLELASAPYGFDRAAAEALGHTAEALPALPARYAPQSAARALRDACVRLLLEASK